MKAAALQLFADALHRTKSSSFVSRTPSWQGVLTLNYHRIGEARNAKGFRGSYSATAGDFDSHLSFLKRNADVISGDDVPSVLEMKRGRYVLLTFDDGFRDNYDLAFPLLRQHGLPATFFICTGLIDRTESAWWEEIAWMIRNSKRSELSANSWFDHPTLLSDDRESAIKQYIDHYRTLPESKTVDFLDRLAELTGTGRPAATWSRDEWMTWDMIREMRSAGMTIGAHTVSHPILSTLTLARQLAEIQGSRHRLETELREQPRLFAYPVGKPFTFNNDTFAALKTSGFDYAFSFYGGHQPIPAVHPYDIRRSNVNWRMSRSLVEASIALPRLFARW